MISGIGSGHSNIMSQMGSIGQKQAIASDAKQDAIASQTTALADDMSASGNTNATTDAELASYKTETQNGANTVAMSASSRNAANSATANAIDTYA